MGFAEDSQRAQQPEERVRGRARARRQEAIHAPIPGVGRDGLGGRNGPTPSPSWRRDRLAVRLQHSDLSPVARHRCAGSSSTTARNGNCRSTPTFRRCPDSRPSIGSTRVVDLFRALSGHDFKRVTDAIWSLNEYGPQQQIEAAGKSARGLAETPPIAIDLGVAPKRLWGWEPREFAIPLRRARSSHRRLHAPRIGVSTAAVSPCCLPTNVTSMTLGRTGSQCRSNRRSGQSVC